MNNRIIRQSKPEEWDTIYQLIRTAFETAHVKDGTEQDFATQLYQSDCFVPELSLVAEVDGHLVGHIMLTRTFIATEDGQRFCGLLVAPLSVLLEHRNQGVGSALMKEGLKRAAEQNYEVAFLVGNPGYYQRFGFQPASRWGITYPGIPDIYVMACEIKPRALDGIKGEILSL